MRGEEVGKFKEKANAFLDTAIYNFEKGRYDLAAFNIEQAVQLYIKTKLLELLGEFPRTHSLVALLRELSRVFKEEEVERFRKENIGMLTKLSDVYITSRYYTREFYEEEVKELIEFAYKVRRLLEYD
ncbi:MAG: HEPN domain-containing protein [Candidatus Methanospirare jalkutatii]|nr:MAG: HEPN domain-containing protein [Candidatus Methanospirare jalkutatii]UYZ40677.1 MAG: HEPN domain-containing protein [Candidatus Methanospirare jalkutatii]